VVHLRASAVGGCVRKQVYRALGLPVKDMACPKTRRMRNMGQILEHMVLQEGLGVFEANRITTSFFCELFTITGHPDHADEDIRRIYEVKSMHTFAWKQGKKEGMAVKYPQYLSQLSFYVIAGGFDDGQFICIDRSSGEEYSELWTREALMPYYDQVLSRAAAIACLVKKNVLPKKDPALPEWACSSEYCDAVNCVHLKKTKPDPLLNHS